MSAVDKDLEMGYCEIFNGSNSIRLQGLRNNTKELGKCIRQLYSRLESGAPECKPRGKTLLRYLCRCNLMMK
jgi:hypothetical protein